MSDIDTAHKENSEKVYDASVAGIERAARTAFPSITPSLRCAAETAAPNPSEWETETAAPAPTPNLLEWATEATFSSMAGLLKWGAHSVMNGVVMAFESSRPISFAASALLMLYKCKKTIEIDRLDQYSLMLSRSKHHVREIIDQGGRYEEIRSACVGNIISTASSDGMQYIERRVAEEAFNTVYHGRDQEGIPEYFLNRIPSHFHGYSLRAFDMWRIDNNIKVATDPLQGVAALLIAIIVDKLKMDYLQKSEDQKITVDTLNSSLEWVTETAFSASAELSRWVTETAFSASAELSRWVTETAFPASVELLKWGAPLIMNGAVMALQFSGPISIAAEVIRARNKIVQMKIFELNQFAKLLSKAGAQLQGVTNGYQRVDYKKVYLDKLVQLNQDVSRKIVEEVLEAVYSGETEKIPEYFSNIMPPHLFYKSIEEFEKWFQQKDAAIFVLKESTKILANEMLPGIAVSFGMYMMGAFDSVGHYTYDAANYACDDSCFIFGDEAHDSGSASTPEGYET